MHFKSAKKFEICPVPRYLIKPLMKIRGFFCGFQSENRLKHMR